MTTAYTSLLGLALPVTGELSGTWGDTVNTAITSLLDTAIAGTTSITTDADITLSTTTGASNQARQAIILWNPASGTTTRNITAPAQSKMYVVINASGGTQSIVIRGAGPTTGVTIAKGESATVAWNGSDFVKVSSSGGAITFTDLTVTGNTILGDAAADTLTVNATSTFASPVSFQNLVRLPSTGRSAAAALTVTAPAFLYGVASTYTDTTSSGTIAAMAPFYSIAQPTLSTSNVTTYTNAATLYIANAPAAGGSATITNPYSLYSAAGANYFGGATTFNSTTQFNGVATYSANMLFSADNTYDIGASGATRPRDMFLGRNLTVGGTLTLAGGVNLNGNVTIGDSSADTLTVNSTITSNLIFTDNTYDIGASGATRPRSMFLGTNLTVGGLSNLSGNVAINGTATAWTNASALTISDYVAIGQRNTGNADGIFSWNAKWSGGTSGSGYTYLKAGDVASAVEQNGEFRFYTTASTGSAGGAIAFSQRALIGNSGLTVNGAVEMATSGIFPTVGFTYNSNGYLYTKGGSAGVITQIGSVNRFGIDSGGRVGFGSTVATADRFIDAAFAGATVSGANQFGMVLNPTYPNTVTSSLFNLYTGANVTAGATFTNAFGLYLEGGNYAGSTVTNKYGLYQAGSSDRNYFAGNVSIGTTAQEGKLTVAYGNESTGQVQLAQFRTEATGSTTYNAGVQIYGTASATAVNRSVSIILDADGANAAGGDYIVLQKNGSNGAAYLYNANNNSFYFGTNSLQTIQLSGTNTYQVQGRSSTAYGITNVQEWTGQVLNIANGASFSLFAINAQYDMLCYDLNIFCSTGGFFSYKSAGVFGYNGFTNTVLGSTCAITITKTGTLYNETMTLTNNQGSTFTELLISLRVWGFAVKNNVTTGGQDIVTSSYLVRQN